SLIYICDYKTDEIKNEESLKMKINIYREQLQYYKESIEKIIGIKNSVIKTVLIFIRIPNFIIL
ncbi:MAG: hypothetical protein ACK4NF_05125, partial [Planctomycetota bacterium]